MEEHHFNKFALTFENNSSYLFPFAIVKWVAIVSKYGGLVKLLQNSRVDTQKVNRFRYKLQLMTVCRKTSGDINETSHVNVSVDCEGVQLSYCGQDCNRIPPALQKMYGPKVRYLDLSYNSIETLKGLEDFTRLEELILDNNRLGDSVVFPCLPRLKTLSLNNNQITDLECLIEKLSSRCGSLTYLSLLSNKACPNELSDSDKDDSDYQRYRYFVIHTLPSLQFLDSRRVSRGERREAATRGQFMRVRRPPPAPAPAPAPVGDVTARPLPVDFSALGKHKGAYGKCLHKYTGKHSEGNRFILNSDL